MVLPQAYALEFASFCRANPRPLPILEVTAPGDPIARRVAPYADVRTDTGRYRVFRDGRMTGETDAIADLWRDDFVTFLLGCNSTVDGRLREAGVTLRHIEQGRRAPMFRSIVECVRAGRFGGRLVVSMRPIRPDHASLVREITSRFPLAHGAPLAEGWTTDLGIEDLSSPDHGDPIAIPPDDIPMFWACGVTAESALEVALPPLAFTHAPGFVLITDLRDTEIEGRTAVVGALADAYA